MVVVSFRHRLAAIIITLSCKRIARVHFSSPLDPISQTSDTAPTPHIVSSSSGSAAHLS